MAAHSGILSSGLQKAIAVVQRVIRFLLFTVVLAGVVGRIWAGGQVWGFDQSELAGSLSRSDYSDVVNVDLTRVRLAEVRRIGDDGAFGLGLVYRSVGDDARAETLLEFGWGEHAGPWDLFCFRELSQILLEQERYPELERLAREAMQRYPSGPEVLAALTRSLYEQDSYPEAYWIALTLQQLLTDRNTSNSLPDSLSTETALWLAVSGSSIDTPGWADLYRSLFRDHPAAHEHSRVWIYLLSHEHIRDAFEAGELLFFRAKQLRAEGASGDAYALLLQVAENVIAHEPGYEKAAELLESPVGLLELYRSAAAVAQHMEAADLFIRLASQADAEIARRAYEYAGRLYRLRGAYGLALDSFERCLQHTITADDERRVRWYWLTSMIRRDPIDLVARLRDLIPLLSDAEYFADAFDELAGTLAERRRYDLVLQTYEALEQFATRGTLARYELVLAEATRLGWLSEGGVARAVYLARAGTQQESRFEALVAAAALGDEGVSVLAIAGTSEPDAPREPSEAITDTSDHNQLLAAAYLRYGLLTRLVDLLDRQGSALPDQMISLAARRLSDAGRVRDAIGAIGLLPRPLTREETRIAYPDPYGPELDALATEETVDRWLLAALVREESYFDPGIQSTVGAVGLMQLLPATAEDVASRMRLSSYSINNPLDNLAIGTHYLRMLSDQFGNTLYALAAYNAGLGRVRTWVRQYGSAGMLLFHQAIPYAETYNHIQKVVVSAAFYGYLYADRTPSETVRLVMGRDF
jgi:soluble lytic murein transglycosylase